MRVEANRGAQSYAAFFAVPLPYRSDCWLNEKWSHTYVLDSAQKYNSKDSVAPDGTLAKIFLCETFLLGKNILSKPEYIHIDICKAIQIRSLHVQKFREVVRG